MSRTAQLGLRERKKLRTRNELAAAARRLFIDRGFDHVTIEQIAAEVEVSPSTFLRYFPRKEDVLFGDGNGFAAEIDVAMAARPREEAVLLAIRHTLLAVAQSIQADRDMIVATAQIVLNTPSLRARRLEDQSNWEHALGLTLAARMQRLPTDVLIRLLAAASIAAMRIAMEEWVAEGAVRPLAHYLDVTLKLLDSGLAGRL